MAYLDEREANRYRPDSGADGWEPNGSPGPDLDRRGPVHVCLRSQRQRMRRFNEIALGLVLLTAALICQFTSITNRTSASEREPGERRGPARDPVTIMK